MRQVVFKKFYIFSAHRPNNMNNHINSLTVKSVLKDEGLSFSVTQGVYKDTKEISFMVFDGPNVKSTIEALCKIYNQECYLLRDVDNEGYLVYPNGTRERIGNPVEVTSKGCDNYTVVQKENGPYCFTFKR